MYLLSTCLVRVLVKWKYLLSNISICEVKGLVVWKFLLMLLNSNITTVPINSYLIPNVEVETDEWWRNTFFTQVLI